MSSDNGPGVVYSHQSVTRTSWYTPCDLLSCRFCGLSCVVLQICVGPRSGMCEISDDCRCLKSDPNRRVQSNSSMVLHGKHRSSWNQHLVQHLFSFFGYDRCALSDMAVTPGLRCEVQCQIISSCMQHKMHGKVVMGWSTLQYSSRVNFSPLHPAPPSPTYYIPPFPPTRHGMTSLHLQKGELHVAPMKIKVKKRKFPTASKKETSPHYTLHHHHLAVPYTTIPHSSAISKRTV